MEKERQVPSGPKGILGSEKGNYISNGEKISTKLQLHFYLYNLPIPQHGPRQPWEWGQYFPPKLDFNTAS